MRGNNKRGTMKFAIFGNSYQAKKSASIRSVLECLREYGADICMDSEFYRFLVDTQHISISAVDVFRGDDFDADFVISMGGDGTFLKSASRVGGKGIPIIGVNMGRLGFLADISPSGFRTCLQSLYEGDYKTDTRTVMRVTSEDGTFEDGDCALNDVAILKRDNASMITIHATIDGEYLTTYQADGLVVSTPTGSTAYSLSNGGPIIVPGTNVLSLVAVAPHSLNTRPIVIADTSTVSLRVECRSQHYLVAIDGRSEICRAGSTVTVCRAPYDVKIVKRKDMRYFSTLREKMMWGADKRE